MLILGAILLIAGFLLCLTIAWAAIGFLAMGLGLICLRIAERRQEQIEKLHPAVSADVEPDRREVAKAIPKQEVATDVLPPELPEVGQRPLYSADSGKPKLPRRSGIDEERRAVNRTVTAEGRSYDAARQRLTVKDVAAVSRLANAARPLGIEYAGQLAATDPTLHDRTQRAAAIRSDPGRARRDATPGTASAGDLLGGGANGGASGTSSPSPPAPSPEAAATRPAPVRPAATSAKGDSVPRKPATDAEDVRNLAELFNKIARPAPGVERG